MGTEGACEPKSWPESKWDWKSPMGNIPACFGARLSHPTGGLGERQEAVGIDPRQQIDQPLQPGGARPARPPSVAFCDISPAVWLGTDRSSPPCRQRAARGPVRRGEQERCASPCGKRAGCWEQSWDPGDAIGAQIKGNFNSWVRIRSRRDEDVPTVLWGLRWLRKRREAGRKAKCTTGRRVGHPQRISPLHPLQTSPNPASI